MTTSNAFASNFRLSLNERARSLSSTRDVVLSGNSGSTTTPPTESGDSFNRSEGMAAGARAFRRDTSIFSSKPVNPGFSGLSVLGEFKPATGDVAEPTASTGVSLRNRGAHSLNNRSSRTFTFGSGLSGPSNGRGLLGNHEPGAGISDGVANGTLDKQGNPSSVPTFGADSRLAKVDGWDMWKAGAGGALTFGSLAAAAASMTAVPVLGPLVIGGVLGGAVATVYTVIKDADREKDKAEAKIL